MCILLIHAFSTQHYYSHRGVELVFGSGWEGQKNLTFITYKTKKYIIYITIYITIVLEFCGGGFEEKTTQKALYWWRGDRF